MEITMQDPVQDEDGDGDGDGDRLSSLPDRIFHRIISFLTLKDLARLSFASRRCQELCNSTPTLSLSNIDLLEPDNILCRLSIYAFLHTLMLDRCSHRVKMQSLSLLWSFQHSLPDEENLVWSWLQHAVDSGVGEFNLDFTGKPFSLPVCVLGCGSLISLVVNTNNGVLQFPSTLSLSYASSSKLRLLTLESVRMEDDIFQQWLPSFKFLKALSLSKVSGMKSMRITSSSIEKLRIASDDDLCHIQIQEVEKLNELYIFCRVNNCGTKSLEISAPNLQRFFWEGFAVDYLCMRSSSHLWQATIDLSLPADQPRRQLR
ncbi:putative F-box/FBD/LRR-repeat protein At4g03220 [Corylus avellana]|uniref:putative F-box/FBD/LRR-repeat protein At4g03220 n=1 Tax=Corylus avellana TaxID=13451 RepID=UPI00286A823E|nr:putative F-box/FBD/LRR-repeat protein At4g03220 [Corylus avellana]